MASDNHAKMPNKRVFYASDPLAVILIDRFRMTPLWFAILIFIISLVIQICLVRHILSGFRVIDFMTIPIFSFFYLWTPSAIYDLFGGLIFSGIFQTTSTISTKEWFLYKYRVWPLSSVGLSVIGVFLMELAYQGPFVITTSIVLIIWYGLCMYLIIMTVIRITITTILLAKLLKSETVRMQWLHPDKSCGLGSIGRYALSFVFLITACGMGIVGWEYSKWINSQFIQPSSWGAHFSMVVYLVLAPICLFGPMLSAHHKMKEAKERFLGATGEEINTLLHLTKTDDQNIGAERQGQDNQGSGLQKRHARLQDRLVIAWYIILGRMPITNTPLIPKEDRWLKLEQLDLLYRVYQIVEDVSTWPFDITKFKRYLIALLSPLGMLLPILTDLMISFYR